MLKQSDIDSPAFRRLTGRLKPPLGHPTAAKFATETWKSFLAEGETNARDLSLATSAIYFAAEMRSLRENLLSDALRGMSPRDIVSLGVAAANRSYLIIRERAAAGARRVGATDGLMDVRSAARTGGSQIQPALMADEVITMIGDVIPHWLFQATCASDTQSEKPFPPDIAGARAEAALSLERSLRNLWQSCLWEGAHLKTINQKIAHQPQSLEHEKLWSAWEYRQESLLHQEIMMQVAEVRRGTRQNHGAGYLYRTVTSLNRNGLATRVKFGKPTTSSLRRQSVAIETAESSYLASFLDQDLVIQGEPVSPRLLLLAHCALADLAEVIIGDLPTHDVRSKKDVDRLKFSVSKSSVLITLQECLGIDRNKANAVLGAISIDATDISSAFKDGIWHRPVIAATGHPNVLLIAAPLMSGSAIRKVERWLIKSGAEDFSRLPRGLIYEDAVRTSLQASLANNPLLKDFSVAKTAVRRVRDDDEEIDLVLRVGKTVLVGEIKCLVVPSESAERFDHIGKLEDAAQQARRKSAWISERPEILEASLGPVPDQLKFQPIIVLNHGVGLGLNLDGVLVTDFHFLNLFLGSPEYLSSSLIAPNGEMVPDWTTLYSSPEEAEERLSEIFQAPPVLEKFIRGVRFRQDQLPSTNGGMLVCSAELDELSIIPDHLKATGRAMECRRRQI